MMADRIEYANKPGPLLLNWDWWRRKLRWIPHPITIFVGLQIVWLATLLVWVLWFVQENSAMTEMAKRVGAERSLNDNSVMAMLIAGCILLGVICIGTIALFIFGQKQTSLARRQRSFLSSVTHELKSPLASIQLTFETLTSREVDPENQKRMMGMVFTDLSRLRRMVDQILIAGRLDRGIESYQDGETRINISDLLEDICSKLSYMEADFRQRVDITCDQNTDIITSKDALVLIFSNLIENAAKYSTRGSPIKIYAGQEAGHLLVSISDQGIGLEKRELRRIFKMFHRAESAEKKAIPGTGLGLFIVRSASRALGGRVWAESAGKGRGTTFFVSLPLVETKK